MSLARRRARNAIHCALWLAFAAKAVVPVGYMPASPSDGWPIKLCHGFMAGRFLAQHELHRHHDHDPDHGDGKGEAGWEHCPWGALAASASLPREHRLHLLPTPRTDLTAPRGEAPVPVPTISFRSRAPPVPA